ncbi:Clp protease N-terminal domain-containing protein [Pseudonocardia petroleophila]|uniref:Clp protease n=1 Tax=Pseudonocardia petroleophila TaxID=37331 RepID=A0A7G7MI12_9PSEU|nr:Clp protease N-terminal domain-containing protein [Pseudonocardia petroleophila]QNG52423.1 Clp protease [Pseudonocardia petroleophila]
MFERFTDKARRVVVLAQEEARERRADAIRSEHLLIALYGVPGNLALEVLEAHSVDAQGVRSDVDGLRGGLGPADAEALSTLGIDLDEVRRQVEDAFGPGALDRPRSRGRRWFAGHVPFDRDAKKVLELALREALRLRHNYIGCEHVLLGLLHAGGSAQTILVARGARLDSARVIVEELLRGRRAG